MGLFSSKKKYYAFAASSQLIPDEDLPETMLDSIRNMNSGMQIDFDASTGKAIRFSLGIDYMARAKSAFKYGLRYEDPEREGGYVRGLPTSNQTVVNVPRDEIEAAMGRAGIVYDNILSVSIGVQEESSAITKWLHENYTNTAVFPWDGAAPQPYNENAATVPIPHKDSGGNYYEAENPPEYFRDHLGLYRIYFIYEDENGDTKSFSPLGAVTVEDEAGTPLATITVKYDYDGEVLYWEYELGSDVDPVLEAAAETGQNYGEYLPVAVLMHDTIWVDGTETDNKGGYTGTPDWDTDLAKTTNKLMKKYGTSAKDVKEQFLEQELEDYEDGELGEAKKWDFFVHMAVPIHTKLKGPMRYLWEFFTIQNGYQQSSRSEYERYLTSGGNQPYTELRIQEAGDTGYNVAYRWSYIDVVTKDGMAPQVINEVGDTVDMKQKQIIRKAYNRETLTDAEYREGLDLVYEGENVPIGQHGEDPDESGYHDYIVFTRQNEDPTGTNPTYSQIVCLGLSMEYTINTSEDGDYRYRYANVDMFDEEAEEIDQFMNPNFRIPVLWGALKSRTVGAVHREEVCAQGLTATVFLVQVVKVKWYQRGFFKWLALIIVIVLIIITIIVFNVSGGIFVKELATYLAVAIFGTTSAIVIGIIFSILAFAIGFLIAVASTLFDPTIGAIFQFIASFIIFGGLESLTGSWSAMVAEAGWGTAITFVSQVMAQLHSLVNIWYAYEMDQLQDEMEDYTKGRADKLQDLQDLYDGVAGGGVDLDAIDLSVKRQFPYEEPQQFYARTLNANPGLLGYDLVYNFTDLALVLPKRENQPTAVTNCFQALARQRGYIVQ